jgi:chitodextrinase
MQSNSQSAWSSHGISSVNIAIAWMFCASAMAVDVTPPSTPSNLIATSVRPASVSLSWNAASDDVGVARYRVFRDDISISTPTGTTYSNSSLSDNTTYAYRVAAIDAAGNESPVSDQITVKTPLRLVEFVSSTVSVSESSGTANVAIRLNGSAPVANSAVVAVSGTAADGSDFSLASTTVTFSANSSSAVLPVAIIDDALAEGAESIVLTLVSGSASQVGSRNVCTVTISANDDSAPPSQPAGLATTSVTPVSVALKWNAASDNVAVVNYEIRRNGSLIRTQSGTTYSNSGLTPSTAYTYTVSAVDAVGNRSAASAPLTVSTPALAVTFSSSSTSRDENSGVVSVAVKLNAAAPSAVSATIALSGTATAASDYNTATTVNFSAGSSTATIPVTLLDDEAAEGSETIVLTLTSASGASIGSAKTFTLTIRPSDDSEAPAAPTGFVASSVGATSVSLRWNASTDNVAVSSYELSVDGTVIRTSSSRSYTHSGLTPLTAYLYSVVAIDSSGNRSLPSAPLTVTTSARAIYFTAPASTSDDVSTIVDLSSEEIGATVAIGMTMNAASADTVSAQFAIAGSATNGSDYSIGATTVSFSPGATTASIPVSIIDDAIAEGYETIRLTLMSVSGAEIGATDSCRLTILNNDGAPAGFINDLSFFGTHYHRDFFRSPQTVTFGWSVVSTFAQPLSGIEWTIRRLDGPAKSISRSILSVVPGEDLNDGHNTMQTWTEDILGGRHTYLVTLDPNNKIAETDESNNTYLFIIDYPVPGPAYTTTTPDLEFFQNSPHFHGSEPESGHEFMFKVRNTGKTVVTGAKWKLSSTSLGFSRERDLGPIGPGEILQYGYQMPITEQGEHDFKLTIDSTNAVTNESETNNSIDFVIVVSPTQGG